MIKHHHYRLRAIRCALSVHRWHPLEAYRTYSQWQRGKCRLYDEHGFIA